ncbi:MAG: hypothetical protein HZB26_19905 [Candidatus Hydrogenedentes bacterium]|nr:hypothetical protein [Candidatus Hydrogenedentota bacterium]
MKMTNLAMPGFNTTLMGVVKGVVDYFGIEASPATVFGGTGHAFLINIHKELCPSGPYCWKRAEFDRLLGNLGVQVRDLGFYSRASSAEERAKVERRLCAALDVGTPCALLNLENQLITGYDAEGFFTAQPWVCVNDFPPARLSFGSWKEFGDRVHASFFAFEKARPSDRRTIILQSLDFAIDLQKNPSQYSMDGYGVGPDAYANWIAAAPKFGASHGNWWNATVWSECRAMASEYFGEIQREYAGTSALAAELAEVYRDLASLLQRVSDKDMDSDTKVGLLREAQAKEAAAVSAAGAFSAVFRAGS